MQGRMFIENPNEVQITLKLTMSAKEWEDLRGQLDSKWPSVRLSHMITDAFSRIRRIVYGDDPEGDKVG